VKLYEPTRGPPEYVFLFFLFKGKALPEKILKIGFNGVRFPVQLFGHLPGGPRQGDQEPGLVIVHHQSQNFRDPSAVAILHHFRELSIRGWVGHAVPPLVNISVRRYTAFLKKVSGVSVQVSGESMPQ
jgi:hypothetical protein